MRQHADNAGSNDDQNDISPGQPDDAVYDRLKQTGILKHAKKGDREDEHRRHADDPAEAGVIKIADFLRAETNQQRGRDRHETKRCNGRDLVVKEQPDDDGNCCKRGKRQHAKAPPNIAVLAGMNNIGRIAFDLCVLERLADFKKHGPWRAGKMAYRPCKAGTRIGLVK